MSFYIKDDEKASRSARLVVQKLHRNHEMSLFSVKKREFSIWTDSILQYFNTSSIRLIEFRLVIVKWEKLIITKELLYVLLSFETLFLEKTLLEDTYCECEQAHLLPCKTISKIRVRLENVSEQQEQPSLWQSSDKPKN